MLRPSPNHGTQRLPNDDEMRDTHSGVMLEGKLLNWHSSITYLGSVLRYDLSDDADIRQKVGILCLK